MADSVLKRVLKASLIKGATWGTAPAVGAGDGLRYVTMGGVVQEPNIVPDVSAGQQLESIAHIGIDKTPQVTMSYPVMENDEVLMLPLAAIFGDDAVTGGSDPYTHTMDWQVESNLFLSLGKQEGDEVRSVPSLAITQVEMSFDGNGILTHSITGIGNRVTTALSTALDDVTFPTASGVYKQSSSVFRINAQSGGALGAGDVLVVSDLKVTPARAMDTVIVTGSDAIIQPKEGAYPTFMISFTIPRKNAMSKTLHAAMLAGTRMKADLTITGSSASRTQVLSLPQIQVESCVNPDADVVANQVVLRAQMAAAAPTGMTGITVPRLVWTCGVSGALV